ncbi:hypothetical protein V0U79_11555 [Hyphobacterium sp. HN65]|uniref:J domain-containing protein n=1 Tax=Hyphobacterium lacteum TaxID=3116575 RepID=A0ABU7LSV9_9PROT|nr:hypothetical protein [Hyphobacterium sp. HN65]MEE2527006.1 hypothetical protein [Hyphobacterium sp. HN65]
MWDDSPDTQAALARLGLDGRSSLADAKAAFRHRARALHPDHTPASEKTLLELAECIRAIRHLENSAPVVFEISLDAEAAANGVTRSAEYKGRSGVFRIAAGSQNGDIVPAIGDPSFKAVIAVAQTNPASAKETPRGGLSAFVDEFATREPAARFAGWLRKAHSAA